MTASESNETSSSEKFILRALVISVLLHLLIFSLWRVGLAQGWWQNLAMPRWMQLVSKAIMPRPVKIPAREAPSQRQLTFVEVDPAMATPEPPKNAKFEGAKNTLAANTEIKKLSEMPNVDGRPEPYIKTIQDAPPKTMTAAPVPPPTPAPTPPQAPAPPQDIAQQNAPQTSLAPGDLTTARPSDKPKEGKDKSDADAANRAQSLPQTNTPAQPADTRIRRLADLPGRTGNYGHPSRIVGGVSHVGLDPSLDVKGTAVGDYMARMVDAVSDHWHKLLERESPDLTGKVVVHFTLHPDGSVSDIKATKSEVGELQGSVCERGIKDPSPFGPWPADMRLEIADDHYDIIFTFYYEL